MDASSPAKKIDWCFATCALGTEAEQFGPFNGLVEMWGERRGPDRRLPRRADFVAKDFADWIDRMFIARVERDPFDLRFVHWGTQLGEWWNVDYTNRTLGALSRDPNLWKSTEIWYFEAMDREPFIGVASGRLTQHNREHIKVIGIDLPLSEGTAISHVLSAHIRVGLEEEIGTVLPDCRPDRYFEIF